jgi:hypothetical protein
MRVRTDGGPRAGAVIGAPILPREHGAWPILYGSFLAGVGVAGRVGVAGVLLLLGITGLALVSGPLPILLRRGSRAGAARRRAAAAWLAVYAGVALAALLPLLVVFRMGFLLPFAACAGGLLAARAMLLRRRGERSLPAELLAVAGLSMVGAVAHAVALGRPEPTGLLLWLLLALFFAGGVLYVRVRLQGMRTRRAGAPGEAARWPCLVSHLAALALVGGLAAVGLVPWATLPAFLPVAWRAVAGCRPVQGPVDVMRLGWLETARTLVFVVLLVGSFWIPRLAA